MPEQPTHDTQDAMDLARGKAAKKGRVRKLKSKIGFAGRTNAKMAANKALTYAISKIPLLGSELSTGWGVVSAQVEKRYKSWKAQSLSKVEKEEPKYEEAIKAAIKSLTINNALQTIDQSRKKVNMSRDEMAERFKTGFSTCAECCEHFYHVYRWRFRVEKCLARVEAVVAPLEKLRGELLDQLKQSNEVLDLMIKDANEFFESHIRCQLHTLSTSPFRTVCIASKSRNFDRRIENTSLLPPGTQTLSSDDRSMEFDGDIEGSLVDPYAD